MREYVQILEQRSEVKGKPPPMDFVPDGYTSRSAHLLHFLYNGAILFKFKKVLACMWIDRIWIQSNEKI